MIVRRGAEPVVDWRCRRYGSGSSRHRNRGGTEFDDAVLAETVVAAESVVGAGFWEAWCLGALQ